MSIDDIVAGNDIIASQLLAALGGNYWTSYTPTWTSTGTQPAIGNGTISGGYLRIGRTCLYAGILTAGSTTTYGTGAYLLSVPVLLSGTDLTNGMIWMTDSSTQANNRMGLLAGASAGTAAPLTTGGNVSNTNPFTWANGDSMRWFIAYQTV